MFDYYVVTVGVIYPFYCADIEVEGAMADLKEIKMTHESSSIDAEKVVETTEATTDAELVYVDSEIEKRALRKFDIFVLPQMAVLVLIAYLDRSNIGM